MKDTKKMYDVIIIGSGPAGYPAAIRAEQLKLKVAIIEKESVGGVCLNWGCIPTKALLHAAEKYTLIKNHAKDLGIKYSDLTFDFSKVVQYSRSKVDKLTSGIQYLFSKNKIELFNDSAYITENKKVKLTKSGKILETKNIVIATGARPKPIRGIEFDHKIIWSYKDAMVPEKLPKSILIIGSGAIGIEFGCIYNSFGTDVTVVELQKNILPTEDKEISNLAKKIFSKNGIKIYNETTVNSIEKKSDSAEVVLSNGEKLTVDRILVAAGIYPNSDNLGLENLHNIKLDNGFIKTNEFLETGEKNIYAIGDIASPPWLAHKSIHEGILCINKIAGKKVHPIKKSNIPSCIYSFPQIASIGLTEDQALESKLQIKIGRTKSESNGKSIILGETDGLVKTIFDKNTGELLGAHMIGHEVTEMIQGYIIAKNLEATEEDLKNIIFPHPTVSEMMHESILAADDEEIHS
jgi:dihydrolipoamide dehydrogenase